MIDTSSMGWVKTTTDDEVSSSCRILQGRSIDAAFLRALEAPSFVGRVHSVFKRVVNIECMTGKLFTLAGTGLDNAPNTGIVDLISFAASGIAVNDPVAAAKGELRVGDGVVMQWTAALTWQASLPRFADADGTLQARLDWAWSYLTRNGEQGGILGQDLSDNSFASKMAITLQERSGSLLEALEQMRMVSARRHAESIIGLGPGLTPAGDDFLVGLFAVLNLRGSPCCGWLGGGKDVLARSEHSTNAISLAALTSASCGQVRESISQLIETLICGTPATLTASLDRVLAIGSTSGADLVAGILAGLNLNLRVEAVRTGSLRFQLAAGYSQRSIRRASHAAIKSTGE